MCLIPQRDGVLNKLDADGRVRGDTGRSVDSVVQAVTDEQGIVRVRKSFLRILRRERAVPDAVACEARAPVALKRLFVE